jgi:uracil-DNA glycosylase
MTDNEDKTRKKKKPIIRIKKNLEALSVLEISQKYYPISWKPLFEDAYDELELVSELLDEIVENSGPFFPEKKNIFRAFDLCKSSNVKVVIFGQDPYHQFLPNGKPRAQGLSFSVSDDDIIPSSLRNIYKELKSDLDIDNMCYGGDLTPWARQGVLLLNTCLTVTPGKAGSHGKIWSGFIKRVMLYLSKLNPHCIYVLWGRHAQGLRKEIEGNPHILESAHPSGLSCKHFFGNRHFSQINDMLKKQNRTPINWSLGVNLET